MGGHPPSLKLRRDRQDLPLQLLYMKLLAIKQSTAYPIAMLSEMVNFVIHLNVHLANLVAHVGDWTYVILFLIIFAETGLVVAPFLPGDSLLFVTGSLAAVSELDAHLVVILLVAAAFLGNLVNYFIGRWFGELLFRNPKSKIFRRDYLNKTHQFYEKYGAGAVVISRFVPLIRTFVPFIAGMAKMSYSRFMIYNAVGAILWVVLLVYTGYFFGQVPFVQENFSWVIIGMMVVSGLPMVIEFLRHYLKRS